MSTSDDTPIQFDRAAFAPDAPAVACVLCQQGITSSYYEVNGVTACETCASGLADAHPGRALGKGLLLAVAAGVGAGVLGALVYYAVLALTGYELAIIAIGVGYLVGRAVRWASGGRGGRPYQVLAVALTYVAIVSTYVPFVVASLNESAAKEAQEIRGPAQAGPVAPQPTATSSAATVAPPPSAAAVEPPPTGRDVVMMLGMFGMVMLALPFLGGFSNIIGLLIIGVGLYEAWKANRRVELQMAGPFAISAVPPLPATRPDDVQ